MAGFNKQTPWKELQNHEDACNTLSKDMHMPSS